MGKAVGGYVRRGERRCSPSAPDAGLAGPRGLRYAALPSGGVICWRDEPPRFEMPLLAASAGQFLHNFLNPKDPPGPPYTHTMAAPEPVILTSRDPEPPPGTVVRDDLGRVWELSDEGGMWWRTDADDDPESWTKVAGNYGPVTVLEQPGPAYTLTEDAGG